MRETRQALGERDPGDALRGRLTTRPGSALEEALILADVGARTTARSWRRWSGGARRSARRRPGAQRAADRAARRDRAPAGDDRIDIRREPTVIHGGRGQRHRQDDDDRQARLAPAAGAWALRVLLGAADTFRAAASEQLEGWARARRLRDSSAGRRAPTRARSPSRPSRARAREGDRRRDHRHGRATAHPGRPDGRARRRFAG